MKVNFHLLKKLSMRKFSGTFLRTRNEENRCFFLPLKLIESKAVFSLLIIVVVGLGACSGYKPVRINAMQAPEIYQGGRFDPFPSASAENLPDSIFYATDRQPSKDLSTPPFYLNERGYVLRLGSATTTVVGEDFGWDELRKVLLLKDRGRDYPIQLDTVNEIGILDRSYEKIMQYWLPDEASTEPRQTYARKINERLAQSSSKDIFIYVHGYKVHFDNPVLVASELRYFLGYQGAFIAYAWPSTPSRWAYFADLETTNYTTRHLRQFIQFLAEDTVAERIHIIGYSAGTRVVINALWDLALMHHDDSDQHLAARYRIGQVLLIGSDYDRDLFLAAILDRLLDIPDRMTVYRSSTDSALGFARFMLQRKRLGEITEGEGLSEEEINLLKPNQELHFINVTDAEKADTGNGHNYFRQSPWVSSDVLSTLRYQMSPEERGLVRDPGSAIWLFPPDYPVKLYRAIENKLSNSLRNRTPKP
ncbi:MAG: alpha/beta hydrolase [Desulfosarcina sp.]|nr:alpha/beta hydrolase [Desulfobacterales bacterium]